MRSPRKLFTVHRDVEFDEPVTLVHAFAGFVDAGAAVRVAVDHILSTCDHQALATFESDELIDYRARRPRMAFSEDHFTSVEMPRITVQLVTDHQAREFLLLSGPEPDYQWERFMAAVDVIVDRFNVDTLVGLSAIPWPIPHTRPLGVTVHGNDPDALRGRTAFLGDIEVPGHVGAMLELRGAQAGLTSIGITAQVPHYLVQFEYPRAAMTLLEGLRDVADISIPTVGMLPAAERAEAEVRVQLAANEDFSAILEALETQYDAAQASREGVDLTNVPSGEQIAAQVEEFLAGLSQGNEKERGE